MKKIFSCLAIVAAAAFVAAGAHAEEKYVAGGFEASGHVTVGGGWQHHTSNVLPSGSVNSESGAGVVGAANGSQFGVIGNYGFGAVPAAKGDYFRFFVDEVELDVMKSFGENVRLRTDLDFGRGASASQGAVRLEQAYATANIPVGNGVEFLLGRFNAPAGFEAIDTSDNDLISQTQLIRANLRPVGLTGLKLYYAFTDMFDLHFYITNAINVAGQGGDAFKNPLDIPDAGFRFGLNWGDEGNESTVGVSVFGGPDSGVAKKVSFAGDVDWNWWITEAFALGGEVLFRRDPSTGAAGAPNMETMAALLNFHYEFSDVWDGTLRYAYTKQFDATNGSLTLTGFEGSSHEIAWGAGYTVADGAMIKFEGRFDWVKNGPVAVGGAAANSKSYDYGAALAFDYRF